MILAKLVLFAALLLTVFWPPPAPPPTDHEQDQWNPYRWNP